MGDRSASDDRGNTVGDLERLLQERNSEIAELKQAVQLQEDRTLGFSEELSRSLELIEYKTEHIVRLQSHVEDMMTLLTKQNEMLVELNKEFNLHVSAKTGKITSMISNEALAELTTKLESLKASDPTPNRKPFGRGGNLEESSGHSIGQDSIEVAKRAARTGSITRRRHDHHSTDEATQRGVSGYSQYYDSSSPSSSSGDESQGNND